MMQQQPIPRYQSLNIDVIYQQWSKTYNQEGKPD